MPSSVVAVSSARGHRFSKQNEFSVRLIAGLGVEGDAHCGATVKHRHRVAKDPWSPNLRQAHLIHEELFAELRRDGYDLGPGDLGENITTRGLDLLSLPRGARLHLGAEAVIEITGLRNPCSQIDKFRAGLMKAVLGRDEQGDLVRKTGVMAIVIAGGDVRAGDAIVVEPPAGEWLPLDVV